MTLLCLYIALKLHIMQLPAFIRTELSFQIGSRNIEINPVLVLLFLFILMLCDILQHPIVEKLVR